ncbi:MAG: putative ferredoxin [Gemmatimonadales bacterium]|jgi:ferredoxin|nr:putative ferredoxin [Gemmatimonadales bacterium]
MHDRKAIRGVTRVTIDRDRCQGHGRCALLAPEVFDLDESGTGEVLVDPVPEADVPEVREAVRSCPESAITTSG